MAQNTQPLGRIVAPSSLLRGALLGLGAMTIFSFYDVAIKFLGTDYNPFQIMFFAGIAAVPLVMGQMVLDPSPDNFRPKMPRLTALRCVIALLQGMLGTYSFTVLPLAQCYAIFFTMPLMITLLSALLLGEKIRVGIGIAALLGFVGVVIALNPGVEPLRFDHFLALLAGVAGALNFVILRKTGNVERPAVLVLYPTLFQLAVMAVILPFVYVPMPISHIMLTWGMACLGIFGTYVVIAAYRAAPAAVVAPMQYSQIFWAALAGFFLFDEAISLTTWIGLGVIIVTGVYILTSARKHDAAATL